MGVIHVLGRADDCSGKAGGPIPTVKDSMALFHEKLRNILRREVRKEFLFLFLFYCCKENNTHFVIN